MPESPPVVRDATTRDLDRVLMLNRTFEHFLSVLDATTLEDLHARATYHRVIDIDDDVGGFLLAFRAQDDYSGANFRWFSERFDEFLYVDRIVVAQRHRGRGFGAMLYEDLFTFARHLRIHQVTCEYDIEPPNPTSARFHAAFGFTEVGQRHSGPAGKRVSMQRLMIEPAPAP